MDRRGFLKSLGFIAGGLAFGGVKAVKGVAKAAIAEKPKVDFPIITKVDFPFERELVPVQPMEKPIGKLFFFNPLDADRVLTNILSNDIAENIDKEILKNIKFEKHYAN